MNCKMNFKNLKLSTASDIQNFSIFLLDREVGLVLSLMQIFQEADRLQQACKSLGIPRYRLVYLLYEMKLQAPELNFWLKVWKTRSLERGRKKGERNRNVQQDLIICQKSVALVLCFSFLLFGFLHFSALPAQHTSLKDFGVSCQALSLSDITLC